MKLILCPSENIQTYELEIGGSHSLDGEITNRTNRGGFEYKTGDYSGLLNAEELRVIADKLDELNKVN